MKKLALVIVSLIGLASISVAQVITRLESGPSRVSLLELYTSEGCSSCPPAEAWLSRLSQSPELWRTIVPVAFHVDYWDNLGWRDRFASPAFTQRQQLYAANWGGDSVYTPGFVLNGLEWRNWGEGLPHTKDVETGKLAVVVTKDRLKVSFDPRQADGAYAIEAVPLKMNASSAVTAGENHGRQLTHQFIAMNLVRADLSRGGESFVAEIPCPNAEADALAVWVTRAGSLTPIQAVGGFLHGTPEIK